MKKNVASQRIGAQMVSATDGSAFTSAVTVYVTLDAGTQAIGSVGSGACTHEGNGYHTYAPSQAETNGDLAAFTFIGTGAVPSTVQVYTSFPQTVDNATNITAIKTKTDFLPSATAGAAGGVFIAGTNAATTITTGLTTTFTGNLTGSVGSVATDGITSGSLAASAITEIQAGLATPTNITAGTITTCTNVTTVNGLAANTVTASALATDAVTEIQAGLATSASQTTMDGKLDTIDNFVDTEVAAIKAVTDKLDTALELDGAVYRYTTNALEQAPTGGGGGADPWLTALPGAYGAGTAGKIVGDNINATISSRATQTSVDDIPTNAELTTALGTSDDAVLARLGTPAGASISADIATRASQTSVDDLPTNSEVATVPEMQAGLATQASVNTIDDLLDTEIAAIKAATDNMATAVEIAAAVLDAAESDPIHSNIERVNDVVIIGTGETGDTWGPA